MSDAWVEWLTHRSGWADRLDSWLMRRSRRYYRWRLACGREWLRRVAAGVTGVERPKGP
jgi:hypothetical protein